jgi:hypothetical protein
MVIVNRSLMAAAQQAAAMLVQRRICEINVDFGGLELRIMLGPSCGRL